MRQSKGGVVGRKDSFSLSSRCQWRGGEWQVMKVWLSHVSLGGASREGREGLNGLSPEWLCFHGISGRLQLQTLGLVKLPLSSWSHFIFSTAL